MMEWPDDTEFVECDVCRAKSGSPTLCNVCLHNRRLIESQGRVIAKLNAVLSLISGVLDIK